MNENINVSSHNHEEVLYIVAATLFAKTGKRFEKSQSNSIKIFKLKKLKKLSKRFLSRNELRLSRKNDLYKEKLLSRSQFVVGANEKNLNSSCEYSSTEEGGAVRSRIFEIFSSFLNPGLFSNISSNGLDGNCETTELNLSFFFLLFRNLRSEIISGFLIVE